MPEHRAEAGQVHPEQVAPQQFSSEEESLEEGDPAEAERDFFAPLTPPGLSLIVSRSELIRARREGRQLPFEMPPNWPPPGWKSNHWPREDSLEGLRQWLELLAGPRGVLVCTLELEQKTGRPCDASAFAHDTWLLVEHLEARGLPQVPHNLERRSYSADQALDVLGKLRKELFGPKPQGGAVQAEPPHLTPGNGQAGNRLSRIGANWEVCFGTERGLFPVADYSALATVAKLLDKPKQAVDLKDLVPEETRKLLERPDLKDDVIDAAGLKDLKRRYEELKQFEGDPDPLVRQENEEEKVRLLAELKKAQSTLGRKRKLGRSSQDRAWDALTKNTRRLYSRLKGRGMPDLAEHLEGGIRFDCPAITYDPPADTPAWRIEV